MKIALPINEDFTLYRSNPHTAPKFAIYTLETKHPDVYFSLDTVLENKFSTFKNANFDDKEMQCNCDPERQENLRHKCDHYALLELIDGCSYLLANKYCTNTKKSMKNSGIKIFKVPSIINSVNIAIKNFLIGGYIANKIQHIHHAS